MRSYEWFPGEFDDRGKHLVQNRLRSAVRFPAQPAGARGTRIFREENANQVGRHSLVSPGLHALGRGRGAPNVEEQFPADSRSLRWFLSSSASEMAGRTPGLAAPQRYTCGARATPPGGTCEPTEDYWRPPPLPLLRSVRSSPVIRDRNPERRGPERRDGLTRCSSCGKRFEASPFRKHFGTSDRSFWNTRSISRYAAGDPDHMARTGYGF